MSEPDVSSDCSGSPSCSTPSPLRVFQTVLFAAPVVFALLVLLLFCVIYSRRNSHANTNSQIRAHILARQFLSAPAFDYGLSKSRRHNLPTIPFDEEYAATHADTQCAVCLCDYQVNEKLHQLPGCKHSFHDQCIDEWLSKNTTCPICRTSLLQPDRIIQPPDGSGVELSRRDHEQWQERIIGDIVIVNPRPDACNGATSSSSGAAARDSSEHLSNIERS